MSVAQRSDAVRNRQRVLDAAAAAYAEVGPRFGMHDVARRANVGVGTVYRHFADREELIEAIARPFFDRTLELAGQAEAEAPAGDRFATFVRAFAAAQAEHGVTGPLRLGLAGRPGGARGAARLRGRVPRRRPGGGDAPRAISRARTPRPCC